MKLRLVSDDERYVVPCQTTSCRQPAVILVIINETPGIPCCDDCARRYYEMGGHTGKIRLAPLSEYVDMYAAAKEAAFATPEQVAPPMQVTGFTAADDEVLRRIWLDQAVYCRMRWCEEAGRLSPATERLNAVGGLWYPACPDCIAKFSPDQVEVAPMSEENTAWELEMAGEYAKNRHWRKPGPPMSRRARILWAAIPAAVLTAGITMVSIGHAVVSTWDQAELNNYVNNRVVDIGSRPDVSGLESWGVALIVISGLTLAGVFLAWMISVSNRFPAGTFRVPRRPVMASQPAASGSWSVPVGDIALWGAWGLAEVERHRRKERARADREANAAYWQDIQDRQAQRRWMDEVVGNSDWQQPMAKSLDYLRRKPRR